MEEVAPVGVRDSWLGVAALFVDRALGPQGMGDLCRGWRFTDAAAYSGYYAGSAQVRPWAG